MRGSNPRHPAHKTGALTTELMERIGRKNRGGGFGAARANLARARSRPAKVENLGIDPSASRMLSERSTI